MQFPHLTADAELAALLEKAKSHVMTPEEIAAQRRSWVTGEMMLEHPEMTREDAQVIYDEMLETLGYAIRKGEV